MVMGMKFLESLRRDLGNYIPEQGDETLGLISALLDQHEEAALTRSTFDPGHITASGFVVSPDRSKVLLIFHQKLQLWLQPGGHVEREDDSVVTACLRELEEETGVTNLASLGLFDLDVHQIPESRTEPNHEHFDVRYAFVAESEDAYAGDGATAVRWVNLDATHVEKVELDESVQRPLRKLQLMMLPQPK
jgi:8-oxo-dGTP pyrophosphatase MutT (NUDIX family)